jgi:hypothetical protein
LSFQRRSPRLRYGRYMVIFDFDWGCAVMKR